MLVVVISAPIEVVPETESVVSPVILPPKTALPVMAKAFVPPAIVELAVMVVPCRVLVAPVPVSVTAPV